MCLALRVLSACAFVLIIKSPSDTKRGKTHISNCCHLRSHQLRKGLASWTFSSSCGSDDVSPKVPRASLLSEGSGFAAMMTVFLSTGHVLYSWSGFTHADTASCPLFTEVQVTNHNIHPLTTYSSVGFIHNDAVQPQLPSRAGTFPSPQQGAPHP